MSDEFDFDKALKALQSGKAITGKDGVLTPLIKKLTEAELDSHLADEVFPNRKNGKTSKTVKSTAGPFELDTPRDRAGSFEPQLVKKHQTSVSDEIEAKILSMYGLGMSYRDIATQVEDLWHQGLHSHVERHYGQDHSRGQGVAAAPLGEPVSVRLA